jgi:hypothetical protein
MERHWRAALRKAANLVLLISLTTTMQPCFAQYTSGHVVQGMGSASDANPSAERACNTQTLARPLMQGTADPEPPCLQGATMGTIGPQGEDATVISGVNRVGTVRINMLAKLEALLNIAANGAEIITIIWGACLMIGSLMYMLKEQYGIKRFLLSVGVCVSFLCTGLGIITNVINCAAFASDPPWKRKDKLHMNFWVSLLLIKSGLSIPGLVNWLVAMARDANLFS